MTTDHPDPAPGDPTSSSSSDTPSPLDPLRESIDHADRQLIEALGERMRAVRGIGALKSNAGRDVRDPGREQRVAARWTALAEESGIDAHAAGRVLAEILQWSRREQERAAPESTAARVAYQGAPGANGDLAARRLMGLRRTPVETLGYRTFEATVDALARGEVDYALLPIENSIVGAIGAANALLVRGDFRIVDEEHREIRHALAALPGVSIQGIQRVLSHPAALGQCQGTVVDRLGLTTQEAWDTAGAAQMVAAGMDATEAAICPIEAAHLYGLHVLKDDVSDHADNWTRFLLLAKESEPAPRGVPCRTTLTFVAKHESGSLARSLAAFADQGVSLTRLTSHAVPGSPGRYAFLVDLEGHETEGPVRAALEGLREAAASLTILGAYPNRASERSPTSPASGAVTPESPTTDETAP